MNCVQPGLRNEGRPAPPAPAAPAYLNLRLDPACPSCATSRDAARPGASEALLTFVVNLEPKGELLTLITQDGDVLVRQADFVSLGLANPPQRVYTIEGVAWVSAREIEGVQFAFDEARLEVSLQVRAAVLTRRQVIDLAPRRAESVLRPAPAGTFFNYNLAINGDQVNGLRGFDTAGEVGVRIGDYLFLSDGLYGRDRATGRNDRTRLSTSVSRDWRDTLQRLVVGDLVASSGTLGSGLRLGGISFSRRYSIDPYLIRFPGQIVSATASLPSEVFVYSNGVLIRRERVQPGTLLLENLVNLTGQQVTEVVVRDVIGNEQRIVNPYYFTDQLLKPGLDEYSFDAGLERRQFGLRSNDYGKLGASAFYRRGATADLTLGFRGEALEGRANLGPTATFRLGTLGVASASASASRGDNGSGGAWLLGHSFAGGRLSTSVALRREDRGYARALPEPGGNRRQELSAIFGYALGAGMSLSFNHLASTPWTGAARRSTSIAFRHRPAQDFYYTVTLLRDRSTYADTAVLLSLNYSFDAFGERQSASAQSLRATGTKADSFYLTGGNADADGLYYRALLERNSGSGGSREAFSPLVQYNTSAFSARAESVHDRNAGNDSYRLGVSGALAGVDGIWRPARSIPDSFAIVKVGEIEGVRVLANNAPSGRTGTDGTVIIPRLASYFENPIAISDKDLPVDAIVPEVRYVVAPAFRSGMLLDFKARRIRAVAGTLVARTATGRAPFGNAEGELEVPGKAVQIYASRDGRFYIEDVQSGEYGGRVANRERSCSFRLRVPEASADPVIDLGEVECEVAPR